MRVGMEEHAPLLDHLRPAQHRRCSEADGSAHPGRTGTPKFTARRLQRPRPWDAVRTAAAAAVCVCGAGALATRAESRASSRAGAGGNQRASFATRAVVTETSPGTGTATDAVADLDWVFPNVTISNQNERRDGLRIGQGYLKWPYLAEVLEPTRFEVVSQTLAALAQALHPGQLECPSMALVHCPKTITPKVHF